MSQPIAVSVLLPINSALPYLAVAVRDIVKQNLAGERLELVCSWDGGRMEDWQWLESLVSALGEDRSSIVVIPVPASAPDSNPSGETGPIKASALFAGTALTSTFPSVLEVAAACRDEHIVRVVRYTDGVNRGQGTAMSLALAQSTAPVVAQMEADDARPREDTLRHMLNALREHQDWHGVCTEAYCFGQVVSRNMMEYCEWQNSLLTPEELAANRFIEIPALHQTAAFRRTAINAVLYATAGCYRDGPCTHKGVPGDDLDTPVDMWWWLEFFALGLRCGRVTGSTLPHAAFYDEESKLFLSQPPKNSFFGWRQHATQRTRGHSRLSIDNLRAIKIHFLFKAFPNAEIICVISVGETLKAWIQDLERRRSVYHGKTKHSPARVVPLEWRPGKQPNPDSALLPMRARREAFGIATVLRLWAYGSAKVRARILPLVPDWDPFNDVFVA